MNERFSELPKWDEPIGLNKMTGNGQPMEVSRPWTLLLVEDDPAVARTTQILLQLAGHRVALAADRTAAYSLLARRRYDAILLDMNFATGSTSGEEGLACIARIIADDPSARIIVITAHSGIRIAVAAMQAGARDFLTKPWRKDDLLAKCKTVIGLGHDKSTTLPRSSGLGTILGDSTAMTEVRALVRRVGPTAASVSVTGRSGSGRTLIANALQAASTAVDAAPILIDLRDPDQWRALDDAKGTLFLRHPDLLDTLAQARLLNRLLPHLRCISTAGSLTSLSPALRRRLCTVEIALPPLAARGGDAVILARHFARVASENYGQPTVTLTPAAEAIVAVTDWPDEVRGLAAAIERATLLSENGVIDAAAIRPVTAETGSRDMDAVPPLNLEMAEKLMIETALSEHRHNISRAALALGISRGTLYRRMAQHGL